MGVGRIADAVHSARMRVHRIAIYDMFVKRYFHFVWLVHFIDEEYANLEPNCGSIAEPKWQTIPRRCVYACAKTPSYLPINEGMARLSSNQAGMIASASCMVVFPSAPSA